MSEVDYPRLDYQSKEHHKRFKKYVERNGLLCQECRGAGEVVNDYHDNGVGLEPIYIECGWCIGTGKITRWARGQWLKYKRMEAAGKHE